MKKPTPKFLLVIASLLFFSCNAFAQWVPLLENTQNDTMFYDPTRIVQNDDYFHVRVYTNFATPKTINQFSSQSAMMHLSINCKKKTFYVLQMIGYEAANLAGKSKAQNYNYPKIAVIPEKSSVAEVAKQICG
jgi:hypothetical protein